MSKKAKIMNAVGSTWGQRITILAVVCILMAFLEPKFFSPANFMSILLAISYYGIMACGMLFCVMVGGIDLSIGSMAALSSTLFAIYVTNIGTDPLNMAIGIGIGIATAVVVGLLHGVFDVYLKMPAFVVTYATQFAMYGLAQEITKMKFIHFWDKESLLYKLGNAKFFGISAPVFYFIVIVIIVAFVLTKTPFGRRMYAVGGNRKAANLVGINTNRYIIIAYIISSVLAAVAGIILVSQNMISSYTIARGYEGPVMMALVVGGVNLMGGEGDVIGVIFGALLVGIIKNVLILVGINTDYNEFVQGVVIVAAVALNVYTNRKAQGLAGVRRKRIKKTADENT